MPVRDLVPPKFRKPFYAAYAAVGVILGAIQVGIAAAEAGQPLWLVVAFPVYAFVGGAFGLTASAHTNTPQALGSGDGFIEFNDAPDNPTP